MNAEELGNAKKPLISRFGLQTILGSAASLNGNAKKPLISRFGRPS